MTIEYNHEIKNNKGGRKEGKKEGRVRINKIKGKIHSVLQMFIVRLLGPRPGLGLGK